MKELPLKDDATKAAISFLEQQGFSVIQWLKFNEDEFMTSSETNLLIKTHWGTTLVTDFVHNYGDSYFESSDGVETKLDEVSHWAYLPQQKRKVI